MLINYKGFGIPLKNIDTDFLKKIKSDLTMRPLTNDTYGDPEEFMAYRINSTRIYVPKFYGLSLFNDDIINNKINIKYDERDGIDVPFEFNGTLRKDQKTIVSMILNEINEKGAAVLNSATGSGKTSMALNMISVFKKKTLIVVHKEFLMNQWKERIEQFLPDASVGIIQQKLVEVDNDICIAMIHSLSMKTYDPKIFDQFGFVIFDEVHHICSRTFSNVMFKVSCSRLLGLSATPIRKDGLSILLNYFLNKILTKDKIETDIDKTTVRFLDAVYEKEIVIKTFMSKGKSVPNISDLVTKICADKLRNKLIIDETVKLINNSTRNIIILSDRVLQCQYINDELRKLDIDSSLYIGSMKQEELDYSCISRVLVATYALASEGFDLPKLDTLIMASGRTDIAQTVGRITRRRNENSPLIIDIIDKKYRYSQFRTRYGYYKKHGFILESEPKKVDAVEVVVEEDDFDGNCFILKESG